LIKVVLDTNIIISALIFGGKPRTILNQIIRKEILGGISDALSVEIRNVLGRNKFDIKKEYVMAATDTLFAVLERVNPEERIDVVAGGPDDNHVLECSAAFNADFIVTGDKHLLQMERFRKIDIVTPVKFLEKHNG
jgi:putative PIN family toxin of toxin-antitoxin system